MKKEKRFFDNEYGDDKSFIYNGNIVSDQDLEGIRNKMN